MDLMSDLVVRVANAADIPALAGLRSSWTAPFTEDDFDNARQPLPPTVDGRYGAFEVIAVATRVPTRS